MRSITRTMVAVAGIAGATLLATTCAEGPTTLREQARPLAALHEVSAPDRATARYIVVLSDTVTNVSESASRLAAAHGGVIRHVYEHVLGGFSVSLPPGAVDRLRSSPLVRYVQHVEAGKFRFGDHSTQTNPPWGLDRIDQRYLPLDARYYHDASTGSGVRVYIVDSGIRTSHTAFGSRASVGFDARPQDGRNGQDCHGHGTHVAGIAGGQTYGVARSANLIAVKVNVACADSIEPDDFIAGINWVAGNHIKPAVANISIGGPADAAVDQAVNDAAGLGVTVAVSAGNWNGADACNFSPARAAAAITVGATSSNDARAGFSNVGPCLDIFAPGDGILSAWATSNTATNTIGGTSMASPHVAGTAAAYLQRRPSAPSSEVRSALLSRATQGVVANAGTGSPNLLSHLHFVDVTISGPTYIQTCGTHTFQATASGVGSNFTYSWEYGFPTGFGGSGVYWQNVGTGPSYSRSDCPGGDYWYLRVTATDEFGFHRRDYHTVQ